MSRTANDYLSLYQDDTRFQLCQRLADAERERDEVEEIRVKTSSACADLMERAAVSKKRADDAMEYAEELAAPARELLDLYNWRPELARMERDPEADPKEVKRLLREYGSRKKAGWLALSAALSKNTATTPDTPAQRVKDDWRPGDGEPLGVLPPVPSKWTTTGKTCLVLGSVCQDSECWALGEGPCKRWSAGERPKPAPTNTFTITSAPPCPCCGMLHGPRLEGNSQSSHEPLEFWRPGDYYKVVDGKPVHCTGDDAEFIYNGSLGGVPKPCPCGSAESGQCAGFIPGADPARCLHCGVTAALHPLTSLLKEKQ